MERVFAIVLTFNAPSLLSRCVRALQLQSTPPEEILIVDNGSEDRPNLEELRQLGPVKMRVLALSENLGPAGGFAAGLSELLRTTLSSAWVMDDDVVPSTDCLEHLARMQRAHRAHVVVEPRIEDSFSGDRVSGRGWWGLLIPRSAVEAAGIPRTQFFWGGEDAEYLGDRLPLAGYRPVRCEDAVVRLTTRTPGSPKPAWKYYYEARNRTFRYLYDRPHVRRSVRLKSLAYWISRQVSAIVSIEPGKFQKLGYFASGVVDGVLRRLGKRVTPDTPDRPLASPS